MPRTGRPKSKNPMSARITIRMDADVAQKLQENMDHYHENAAQSIRRGIEEINKGIKK
ncbi:MAG: hypothetical protein Q4F18_11050 [Clostridia bacterium]|nr:hypothetical protein [Clostridia bacterium]